MRNFASSTAAGFFVRISIRILPAEARLVKFPFHWLSLASYYESMETATLLACCPTCETLFERLSVKHDEDGGNAFLEVGPCAYAICGKIIDAPVATSSTATVQKKYYSQLLWRIKVGEL
jgi:hypothetical protein